MFDRKAKIAVWITIAVVAALATTGIAVVAFPLFWLLATEHPGTWNVVRWLTRGLALATVVGAVIVAVVIETAEPLPSSVPTAGAPDVAPSDKLLAEPTATPQPAAAPAAAAPAPAPEKPPGVPVSPDAKPFNAYELDPRDAAAILSPKELADYHDHKRFGNLAEIAHVYHGEGSTKLVIIASFGAIVGLNELFLLFLGPRKRSVHGVARRLGQSLECPHCGLTNPATATRCDCGQALSSA